MKKHQVLFSKLFVTAAVAACMGTVSYAQTTGTDAGTTTTANAPSGTEAAMIAKNIRDNKMEIQLAQMALDKSSDAQVRNVARQMVTDHTQILNDLRQLAMSKNITDTSVADMGMGMNTGTSGNGMATGNASAGNTGTASTSGTVGTINGSSTDSSATMGNDADSATTSGSGSSSVTENTTNSNETYTNKSMQGGADISGLANASGAEFNRMWVSQLTDMHQAKVDELQSALNTVQDPQLKAAINKALPKIKMHLSMLKKADTGNNGSDSSGTGTSGQ